MPLEEIIAQGLNLSVGTKRVENNYKNLIEKFESEFNILLNVGFEELKNSTKSEIAEGIIRVREGKVFKEPGYDGVYGKIRIFSEIERKELSKQETLF